MIYFSSLTNKKDLEIVYTIIYLRCLLNFSFSLLSILMNILTFYLMAKCDYSHGSCFIYVKPRENPIFWKKGKIVISVKIRNFSRSRMTKQISPLNCLAKFSYHVEFRWIPRWSGFHVFQDAGCRMTYDKVRGCHMAHQECDTWNKRNGSH